MAGNRPWHVSGLRTHSRCDVDLEEIDVAELNFSKGNSIGVEHLRVPPDLLTDQELRDLLAYLGGRR